VLTLAGFTISVEAFVVIIFAAVSASIAGYNGMSKLLKRYFPKMQGDNGCDECVECRAHVGQILKIVQGDLKQAHKDRVDDLVSQRDSLSESNEKFRIAIEGLTKSMGKKRQ